VTERRESILHVGDGIDDLRTQILTLKEEVSGTETSVNDYVAQVTTAQASAEEAGAQSKALKKDLELVKEQIKGRGEEQRLKKPRKEVPPDREVQELRDEIARLRTRLDGEPSAGARLIGDMPTVPESDQDLHDDPNVRQSLRCLKYELKKLKVAERSLDLEMIVRDLKERVEQNERSLTETKLTLVTEIEGRSGGKAPAGGNVDNREMTDGTGEKEMTALKHDIHCIKYELKKLKLISEAARESEGVVETRDVNVISPNELDTVREAAESAHREANEAKEDVDKLRSEVELLRKSTEESKEVAEAAQSRSEEAKEVAGSANSTSAEAKTIAEAALRASESGGIVSSDSSPVVESVISREVDVLKHDIHCIKYELKKLKLISEAAMEMLMLFHRMHGREEWSPLRDFTHDQNR
jgi:cell division septum initiation protein DivIVA